jgi:hypothetical protein
MANDEPDVETPCEDVRVAQLVNHRKRFGVPRNVSSSNSCCHDSQLGRIALSAATTSRPIEILLHDEWVRVIDERDIGGGCCVVVWETPPGLVPVCQM